MWWVSSITTIGTSRSFVAVKYLLLRELPQTDSLRVLDIANDFSNSNNAEGPARVACFLVLNWEICTQTSFVVIRLTPVVK